MEVELPKAKGKKRKAEEIVAELDSVMDDDAAPTEPEDEDEEEEEGEEEQEEEEDEY